MSDSLIAVSSCQYPADFFRYRAAYESLGAIADLFTRKENRARHKILMLAGDVIYSDATAGVFDAMDPHERYQQQYDKLKNTWAWKLISTSAHDRMFSIDDHELIEGWEPVDPKFPDPAPRKTRMEIRQQAVDAFVSQPEIAAVSGGKTYYENVVNGLPFFIMDTRTERQYRSAKTVHEATMVSGSQLDKLFRWIDKLADNDRGKSDQEVVPKFIMSGSMLLPRLRSTAQASARRSRAAGLKSDGWDGYPFMLHTVLHKIASRELRKVIFLSGDVHIPAICNATIQSETGSKVKIMSVHGSALNAPLPFANARQDDFVKTEELQLCCPKGRNALQLSYNTKFPDVGDGFAVIEVKRNQQGVAGRVSFAGKKRNYSALLVEEF